MATTPSTAQRSLREPGSYDGFTPLVAFGDITSPGDADVFEVQNQGHYRGPITFRLQTTGVSLLAARMVVTDEDGRVLAAATGSGMAGSVLTVTLPRSVRGEKYYVRVLGAPDETNSVGRYGLGVTFNGLVRPTAMPLAQVLRGPYDALDEDDIEALFTDPSGSYYDDDAGTDDEPALAGELPPLPGFPEDTRYAATASLAAATDADFYAVRAPQSASDTAVLTAAVREVGPNGTTPRIQLFRVIDEATMTSNRLRPRSWRTGTGRSRCRRLECRPTRTTSCESATRRVPATTRSTSRSSHAPPKYEFGSATAETGSVMGSTLFVGRSQVFGFALSATGPAGAAVTFSLVNAAGRTVFSLTAPAGDTVTGTTPLVSPGRYTLRMTVTGPAGPVQFTLSGGVITDPIGPQPANSVAAPQYQNPANPTQFVYPTPVAPTLTADPYLFLPWFRI